MEAKKGFSKYIIWAVAIVAALAILSKPKSNLYVTSISGKPQLSRAGQTLYLIAVEPVYKGDKIVVNEGSVKLNLISEQSSVELKKGATIHIAYDAGAESNAKSFKVTSGTVKFSLQAQTEDKSININAGNTLIKTADADLEVSTDDENSTVSVLRGIATLCNSSSKDLVEIEEKYIAEFQNDSYANINSIGKTSLPKVLNYTVINPDTDLILEKYTALKNGAQISISDLPEAGYNLRANIANISIIKHVRFTLTDNAGRKIHTATSSSHPFALAGLKNSQAGNYDFNAYKVKPGTYLLTVDVFTPKSAAPVYSSKFKYTLK